MQEIKKENFSFSSFFQTNYGLGYKPTVPALNKKNIVFGVLAVIVGIVLSVVLKTAIAAIICAVIGAILIVPPILKNTAAKAYLAKWNEEFQNRSNTWWGEFDKTAQKIIDDQKLKERGMEYLGIDADQLAKDENMSDTAFFITGNNWEGGWRRRGDDWRTEYREITWLYFGKDQLYIYRVKLSLMNPQSKKEESQEFFFKDIVSVSVAQESIDIKGTGSDGDNTKQVDSERFRLVVPGDKLSFAYTPTQYVSKCINQMKSLIREKKNG